MENSALRASVAGPAAMMPAIVSTIQAMTTVRLWASTQRVSEDTSYLLVVVVAEACRPCARSSIGDFPWWGPPKGRSDSRHAAVLRLMSADLGSGQLGPKGRDLGDGGGHVELARGLDLHLEV